MHGWFSGHRGVYRRLLWGRRCAVHHIVRNLKLLDLGRTPYVVYGVKYIDLVSLMTHYEAAAHHVVRPTSNYLTWVVRNIFCVALNI